MIALTTGQARRRLIARCAGALAAMSPLIILMGLLFHGGQLLFRGGSLAMGTCANCCPSGGCSTCQSLQSCGPCVTPNLPTQWTLVVTSTSPCGFATSPPYDGTYVLTQGPNSSGNCLYTYSSGGITIQWLITPTGYILIANDSGFSWLTQSVLVTVTSCCVSYAFDDQNTDCAAGGFAAVGGHAVLTPC